MKRFIADSENVEQSGAGLRKRDEETVYSMLLSLAKEACFDEEGCLRNTNGETMPGTSVGKLVSFACRPEQRLKGTTEFIEILKRIGIHEVPNENMMMTVINRPPAQKRTPRLVPPPPTPEPTPPSPEPPSPPLSRPESGEAVPLPEPAPSVALKRRSRTKSAGPQRKTARITWQLRSKK